MKNGIIAVSKPEGMTSAHLVNCLKKILSYKKIGHTGTLDPFACGLMICGVNQGTRLSRFFLDGDKTYRARLCLGIETDTQDLTGSVIRQVALDGFDLEPDRITQRILAFRGKQQQIPPAFSALKHNGKPLYEYARKGRPVVKPARTIYIHQVEVLDVALPFVDISVSCSSGTYIRTVGHDIGRSLGCGAHLTALCRTRAGGFELADACTLDDLGAMAPGEARGRIIPMADAVGFLPKITADDALERKISFGQRLGTGDLPDREISESPVLRIVNRQNDLLAIVTYDAAARRYNYSCVFSNELV